MTYVSKRIFLREMLKEDAPYIVRWRNDPDIRKWMFNDRIINEDKHLNWFESRGANRIDFMVCDINDGNPIGTVNYVIDKKGVAESGRLLGEKSYYGKGYGTEMASLWLWVGFNKLKIDIVIARTKSHNEANIKLNNKLGFKVLSSKNGIVTMSLNRSDWEK